MFFLPYTQIFFHGGITIQQLSIVFYLQPSTAWLLFCSSLHHQDQPLPLTELRAETLPHRWQPPPTYPAGIMGSCPLSPPPPTHTSPALRCDLGQSDSSILPPCFASPSRHQNRAGLPSKFTPTKRSYVSIEASIKSRVSLKSATKINIESIASKSSPRTGNTNLAGLPT